MQSLVWIRGCTATGDKKTTFFWFFVCMFFMVHELGVSHLSHREVLSSNEVQRRHL